MCHNVPLDSVKVDLNPDEQNCCVNIIGVTRCTWKTGVEMEALTSVSAAALTLYDMCKAIDKSMVIGEIKLLSKTGGKSGTYLREDAK
jgi:cyclic pyranopterin phosphate synthase